MDKVKTELAYKDDGVKYKWGFDVKKNANSSLRWFKLLLHNADDDNSSLYSQDYEDSISREKFRRLKETVEAIPDGKTPCGLAADYLKALHNHLMVTLGKQHQPLIKMLGKEVQVHYYLTVPAVSVKKRLCIRFSTRI